MANTVSVLMRIKECGKRPYIKPAWNSKKLKPFVGLMNGLEVHRPEASYYLRFIDEGKNVLEPVGKDPAEVLTFLAVRQATLMAKSAGVEVKARPDSTLPDRVTIHAAISAYIERLQRDKRHEPTVRAKKAELAEFAKFCPRRFMDEITHDDMVGYREYLLSKGLAEQTVFNKLICCVTWQRRNPLLPIEGILQFPDDYPEQKPTVPEPYSAEEVSLLKKHASAGERLILNAFLATGCRDQEIAHLEYSDLNPATNTVRIQKKDFFNWKPESRAGTRNIPISAALLAELKATNSGNRLVFPSVRTGVEKHFLRMFQELGKRAGVTCILVSRCTDLEIPMPRNRFAAQRPWMS